MGGGRGAGGRRGCDKGARGRGAPRASGVFVSEELEEVVGGGKLRSLNTSKSGLSRIGHDSRKCDWDMNKKVGIRKSTKKKNSTGLMVSPGVREKQEKA